MLSRFRLVEIVVMMIITLAFSFGALAQDEVLTIGTTSQVTELSPANSYDSWTWHTLRQVTETLVTIVPGTGEILPLLAESWEVSDDATVYTFHLRQGVIFWDGAPFDAKAMKWVLERNLALNGPEGAVSLIQIIDDIAVVDDYTLRIEIGEPNATFLALLADPIAPAMALSPECTPLDEFANGCFAGTGPYRLVEHIPGQQTVYESFPEYWGDPPKIARVVERFFDDSSSLLAALESGQIDIAYDHTLTWNDISELRGNPNLQVLFPRAAGNRIRYLVCNVTAPPFDNVHVRRALAYAVDRDQLNASVFFGLNTPVYSMVPPDVWGHIDSFPKRDLERALQELHQAGYSSSNPLEITIYGSTHYGSEESVVAEALKIALEQTGAIEVNTSVLDDWGDYVQKMVSGDLDFFLLGWNPDFIDPDNCLSPWLVDSPDVLGTNLNRSTSAYDKSVYDDVVYLLTQARQTSDLEERIALYEEAQVLLADSAVLIPLYLDHRETCVITRSGIDGLVFGLNATLQNWSIQKGLEVPEGKKWVTFDRTPEGTPPDIVLLDESDKDSTVFEIIVHGVWVEQVKVEGERYQRLWIPGLSTTQEVGKPELPVVRELIGIVTDAESAYIDEVERIEPPLVLEDYNIYPYQQDTKDCEGYNEPGPFEIDQGMYDSDTPYPYEDCHVGEIKKWLRLKVANVTTNILKYRPASKVLEVYRHLRVTLKHTGDALNKALLPVKESAEMMFNGVVLNAKKLAHYFGLRVGVKYLILTANRFVNDIQPLAVWKRCKGLEVTIKQVPKDIANTTAAIKAFIRSFYNQSWTYDLYVLLVGDVGDIKTGSYTSPIDGSVGDSDHTYECVDGTDSYPDLFLGRISADDSADVCEIVRKILTYEQIPPSGTWMATRFS